MSKIPENTQYRESTTIPTQKLNIPERQAASKPPAPVEAPKAQSAPEPTTPQVRSDFGAKVRNSQIAKSRESTTIPVQPQAAENAPRGVLAPVDRSGVQKMERTARRGNFLDYNPEMANAFRANAPANRAAAHPELKVAGVANIEKDFPVGKSMKSMVFKDENGRPLPFQCGEFINHLTGMTVGNTIAEKKSRIDHGITWGNVKPGNTVVVDIGNYGHVASVLDTIRDAKGNVIGVKVIEANKDMKGTVNYGTYMASNGRVLGFQPTGFTQKYSPSLNLDREIASIFNNKRS